MPFERTLYPEHWIGRNGPDTIPRLMLLEQLLALKEHVEYYKEKHARLSENYYQITADNIRNVEYLYDPALRPIKIYCTNPQNGESYTTELHALYSSLDIIRNIKPRRLRWAGHVAPLGRPRRRWEANIKMNLREMKYDARDWINLAQDEGGNELLGSLKAICNDGYTKWSSSKNMKDIDPPVVQIIPLTMIQVPGAVDSNMIASELEEQVEGARIAPNPSDDVSPSTAGPSNSIAAQTAKATPAA
ncbi:hypothetical protein ANN_03365 [Periplaneta americana]|uniref:Uncharacterized protein n=1 Tax=Periplaneta americana TaxID=6978 RepID=A0ABQ8TYU7_PERAM|nr:hypothetical protein ANN_03365 [Periplaneta americana]